MGCRAVILENHIYIQYISNIYILEIMLSFCLISDNVVDIFIFQVAQSLPWQT